MTNIRTKVHCNFKNKFFFYNGNSKYNNFVQLSIYTIVFPIHIDANPFSVLVPAIFILP